jgi:endogenous inhibitor of DNA gyrase (YacG/DUF329 family)
MITCPNCSAVSRRIDGLHQAAAEPFLLCDQLGWFMNCPTCETKVRWKDDEPAEFGLGDAPTLA